MRITRHRRSNSTGIYGEKKKGGGKREKDCNCHVVKKGGYGIGNIIQNQKAFFKKNVLSNREFLEKL